MLYFFFMHILSKALAENDVNQSIDMTSMLMLHVTRTVLIRTKIRNVRSSL